MSRYLKHRKRQMKIAIINLFVMLLLAIVDTVYQFKAGKDIAIYLVIIIMMIILSIGFIKLYRETTLREEKR